MATTVPAAFPERPYPLWVSPGGWPDQAKAGQAGELEASPPGARPSPQAWLTYTYPHILCLAEAFSQGLPAHTEGGGARQAGACHPEDSVSLAWLGGEKQGSQRSTVCSHPLGWPRPTVSESWAGGVGAGWSVAVTTPSTKAVSSTKAPACILSGKGSCRPGPPQKGSPRKLKQTRTSQVLAFPWGAAGLQSPNSQINPKPGSGAAYGQGGFCARAGQGKDTGPRGGGVSRRPSNLLVPHPPLCCFGS